MEPGLAALRSVPKLLVSASVPWAALEYAEKVRTQFLSLRQIGLHDVFSSDLVGN
jgi:hypothetical protein